MYCIQAGLGESLVCNEFLGTGRKGKAGLPFAYIFVMSRMKSLENFRSTTRRIYFYFLEKSFPSESMLVHPHAREKLCNHPR